MLRDIAAAFLKPDGPFWYLRLVTAAYAISAIGRLIPVKRKQVPGYRRRVPLTVWARRSARRRARSARTARSPSAWPGTSSTAASAATPAGLRARTWSAGPEGAELRASGRPGQVVYSGTKRSRLKDEADAAGLR